MEKIHLNSSRPRLKALFPALLFLVLLLVPACQKKILDTVGFSSMPSADGKYKGKLEVNLLGGDYGPYDMVYELKDGKLCCDFPKIGKMPGTIRIDMPVEILENGTLSAINESLAGYMIMPGGTNFRLTFHSFDDARVIEGKMSFSADVSAKILGVNYPTKVRFIGYREK